MKKLLGLVAFFVAFAVVLPAFAETLTEEEKNMQIAERTQIRILIEDLGNYRDAQVAAADKLVAKGNSAVPMLIRYLHKAENENIRANICVVLGRIGAPSAIESIGAAFADKSMLVRYKAQEGLRLLARANTDAALSDVTNFLREKTKDANENIRSLAVEVLVDLNPSDIWTEIIVLLQDSSAKVRADSAKALGGISAFAYDKPEMQATICNAIIPLCGDSVMEVRRSAAISLGFYLALSTMYQVAVYGADEKFSKFDESPNLGLAYKMIDSLIAMLGDADESVRANAAYSLGKVWVIKAPMASDKIMDSLIKALDDTSSEVRMYTAMSLGQIGDEKAVGALIDHLGEKVPLVLNVMVESLRKRTLKDFGFQPYEILDETPEEPIDTPDKYKAAREALEKKRQEAIDKWVAWWQENKGTFKVNPMIR
ncbi:MAG: HEAT repeat domain-containing protein [Candidatus Brocadiia bacterium]